MKAEEKQAIRERAARDEMFPLVEQRPSVIESALELNPEFASGYMRGMVDQRNADWERLEAAENSGRG